MEQCDVLPLTSHAQSSHQSVLMTESAQKIRAAKPTNGCIPVHLDFILPVHLDRHTSGSSRRSYLRFIQSFHTSSSSRFHSYLWFIQIFFIPLVHLEHHTSGSPRFYSQHWFIQNIIPPVHLDSTITLCPKQNQPTYLFWTQLYLFKPSPYFNLT